MPDSLFLIRSWAQGGKVNVDNPVGGSATARDQLVCTPRTHTHRPPSRPWRGRSADIGRLDKGASLLLRGSQKALRGPLLGPGPGGCGFLAPQAQQALLHLCRPLARGPGRLLGRKRETDSPESALIFVASGALTCALSELCSFPLEGPAGGRGAGPSAQIRRRLPPRGRRSSPPAPEPEPDVTGVR